MDRNTFASPSGACKRAWPHVEWGTVFGRAGSSGKGRVIASQTSEYAQVVIYAKRFEDLPIVNKVGEIIRLHRATLRMYRNMRQFNVSTQWNGSWAQFAGEEGEVLQPQFYSGKRATFEKHEAVLLQSLRKFTTAYF